MIKPAKRQFSALFSKRLILFWRFAILESKEKAAL
jgi:hypothetical protein